MKTQIEQLISHVCQVSRDSGYAFAKEDLRRYVNVGGLLSVKVGSRSGNPYAFCASRIVNGVTWIDCLLVTPKHRGAGFGSSLLSEVASDCTSAVVFVDHSHPDSSDYVEWLTAKSRAGLRFARLRQSPRANRLAFIAVNQNKRFLLDNASSDGAGKRLRSV